MSWTLPAALPGASAATTTIFSARRYAARLRAGGHQREGNFRGAADGQRAGCVAQPVVARWKLPASTAEIVGRINRHLYLYTTEDRYATFFFAIYDSATACLRYTNAGHPAPFCISGGQVHRLEVGGTVVGVFDDYHYEEGTIQIEPGSLLVIFSDGLVEPENVYGEEFGSRRLAEVALRNRQASAHDLVESLLSAAEEWAGTAEQADDMTVIVARLRRKVRL